MKHKGHNYEVKLCNPAEDWGDASGLFRVECAVSCGGFYQTYAEANAAAKSAIDKFVNSTPQTEQEWIDAVEKCMVWTGYEDCHIDPDMILTVLGKAALYFHQTTKKETAQ